MSFYSLRGMGSGLVMVIRKKGGQGSGEKEVF